MIIIWPCHLKNETFFDPKIILQVLKCLKIVLGTHFSPKPSEVQPNLKVKSICDDFLAW